MSVRIEHGDCREVIKTLADASVDSCVCDPPYELGFMGRAWDRSGVANDVGLWSEVLRVLKPGAHLIAFSGTRTYHRMACAIEDAGFEIRDQIGWLYGSGFPKSHDVSKGIDRAAGAERDVVGVDEQKARRFEASLKGQNDGWDRPWMHEPDATIRKAGITAPATDAARAWQGWGTALKPAWEPICLARKPLSGTVAQTVLEHGTGAINIDGCRVGTESTIVARSGPSAELGYMRGGSRPAETGSENGRWPANVLHDGSAEVLEAFAAYGESTSPAVARPSQRKGGKATNGDTGTAARFFYSAKADADDRLGSKHPTVKPVDLMAYLCRLVTPPGGLVLDPFAGSGTTGMACLREGFNCILIEREAEYIADINRRLAHVRGADTPLFGGSAA
jgi:DNA modification methylase